MKKIIVFLMVVCTVLLVGCSDNKNTKTKSTTEKSTVTTTKLSNEENEQIKANKKSFESNKKEDVCADMLYYDVDDDDDTINNDDKELSPVSAKNIKVTTYKLSDNSGKDYHNYLIANLHNNGKDNLIVRMYVEFLDDNKNVIGSDVQTVKTLCSKGEYPLRFTSKYKFDNFRYKLKAYNTDSGNVQKIVESEITKNNNVISVKATNKSNGNYGVLYSNVAVMLFENGKLVDYLDGEIGKDIFSDVDYGLQLYNNEPAIQTFNCNIKYDTAKVYFDGYAEYLIP